MEDNQSTARDKKNGLVGSLSSLFRSNDGTDDSYDMLMSPALDAATPAYDAVSCAQDCELLAAACESSGL